MLDGQTKRYLTYEDLKTIDADKAFGVDITKKEDHLIGIIHSQTDISLRGYRMSRYVCE